MRFQKNKVQVVACLELINISFCYRKPSYICYITGRFTSPGFNRLLLLGAVTDRGAEFSLDLVAATHQTSNSSRGASCQEWRFQRTLGDMMELFRLELSLMRTHFLDAVEERQLNAFGFLGVGQNGFFFLVKIVLTAKQ